MKEQEKNTSLNLIYYGLTHLIWIIDKLGYSYMIDWRNAMCKWQMELEMNYGWLEENIRSWKKLKEDKSAKAV